MHRWMFVSAFLVLPLLAAGQEKPKADPTKLNIPGYTTKKMEGFTVLISDETMREDAESKLERKPMAALQHELKTLATICPPKILTALQQNFLIWVEWDEQFKMNNGREGLATAVFMGGHQQDLLNKGMHPLKMNAVTVMRMKKLTEEHQPKKESGRCVMLHEMVHAIHYQVIGKNNPDIGAAYKQAMERKLLDPEMYAATNVSEFFAEMACAFFNQLNYYPKTRTDLKKNDPVTFKLMESIWGKTRLPDKPNTASTQDFSRPLADVLYGEHVFGPKISLDTLKGNPALLVYWNAGNPSSVYCFRKVLAWDSELADFGLKTAAFHLKAIGQTVDLAAIVRTRKIHVSVFDGKWSNLTFIAEYRDFPQALVYNDYGVCTFKGSPFDAETAVRSAVGNALLEKADIEEPHKSLQPVVDALRSGKPPAAQLSRVLPLTHANDETLKEQA
ncbi:MAG TPA: hypothetical protein VGZ47_17475, partial [Gemmataceae bacterium]|nr:hypothetical protein [Gemmataceae bacterium]